jgi:cerevisin
MKGIVAALVAAPLAAGSPLFIDTIHSEAAPIVSSVNSEHVPDSYIVVFKDHVSKAGAEAHHAWVQDIHETGHNERLELRKRGLIDDIVAYAGLGHVYHMPGKLLGYSGHFDPATIEQVRASPDVE